MNGENEGEFTSYLAESTDTKKKTEEEEKNSENMENRTKCIENIMDPAISESDNRVTIERSAEALMCNGHGESHPQEDSNKNSSGQECCESNHVGGEGNPMEEGSTTDDGNQRRSQSPGVHSSSPSEKSNSSGQFISLSVSLSLSLSLSLSPSLSLSTRK